MGRTRPQPMGHQATTAVARRPCRPAAPMTTARPTSSLTTCPKTWPRKSSAAFSAALAKSSPASWSATKSQVLQEAKMKACGRKPGKELTEGGKWVWKVPKIREIQVPVSPIEITALKSPSKCPCRCEIEDGILMLPRTADQVSAEHGWSGKQCCRSALEQNAIVSCVSYGTEHWSMISRLPAAHYAVGATRLSPQRESEDTLGYVSCTPLLIPH